MIRALQYPRVLLATAATLLLALAAWSADRSASREEVRLASAGRPTTEELKIRSSTISISFGQGEFDLPRSTIVAWVQRCAEIVASYYGQFPVSRLKLVIQPVRGGGVRGGATYGQGMSLIRLPIGVDVTPSQLEDDWVLIHEMVHLAFPDLDERHLWLLEGQATYIEGIARVQQGQIPATRVWSEFTREMSNGLPRFGDAGLDRTHTWGRTYWGGALFCLLADVQIRQRTDNRLGLQDALRAVVREGGVNTEYWDIERALAVGDRATGTTVLVDLYNEMKHTAVTTDLPKLWGALGVIPQADEVSFDERAPLAGARRAIMTRNATQASR
jgi:hypothetical protein